MNDPNGLIFFRGRYHAFFQYNPDNLAGGPKHWGHAVSDDLIHWEELQTALYPDKPYEDSGGCYSGSAVEKDGKLWLFYTSVSEKLGQTQSVAVSEDGLNFEKYAGNPIIRSCPISGTPDFRDPRVTLIDGHYYMVCGSGKGDTGKILLFRSDDLFNWDYRGVLFEGSEFGPVFECPDFFKLGDRYVLMFSQMFKKLYTTMFIIGDFENEVFSPLFYSQPEAGRHFYAPQTFEDGNGRRIMIGWLYCWGKPANDEAGYTGAFTVPRELRLLGNRIYDYPVSEAESLLTDTDELVNITDDSVEISGSKPLLRYEGYVDSVKILRDTKTLEVFINGGQCSFSYWLD